MNLLLALVFTMIGVFGALVALWALLNIRKLKRM